MHAGSVGSVTALLARLGLADEAVHLAAVDVARRVRIVVRSTTVDVGVIDVGRHARAVRRIGHAHGRLAVLHRDPVGARKRTEVGVERPVLLHDHDDVLDLVDAGRDDVAAGGSAAHPFHLRSWRGGAAGARRGDQSQCRRTED